MPRSSTANSVRPKVQSDSQARIAIAFVIHSMRVGGAERSIARLINVLNPQRFAPLVICLTETGPAVQWIEAANVPVFEIHKRSNFDLHGLRKLTRLLRQNQVQIVQSYNWGTLLETRWACLRAGNIAHVHSERGSVLGAVEMRGLKMRLRGHAAGWAMRQCDAVISNARSVAQRIEQRCGFPANRVQIIPNGVEVASQHSSAATAADLRRRLGIQADDVVMVSVGRLVPVKGYELAVRALATLTAATPTYHLILVGDGPEAASLALLARELGVDERVHFVGHQQEVSSWLAVGNIYLNTSHSEGMSQSLVEALAMGCPAIATDVGDSAEVLGRPSECGRIVPPGDVHGIASAIVELTNAKARELLSQKALDRHARLFSAATMADAYESLYDRILQSKLARTSTP